MNPTHPKVDRYIERSEQWHHELTALRNLILSFEFEETFKWGVPCYTYQHKNILLIHTFKKYCAVLFFKGALLEDPEGILVQQTKNTQAARQLRFTSLEQVEAQKATIRAFIDKAIAVEDAGLEVVFKETEAFEVPPEFETILAQNPALRPAFEALTPGRRRGYLLHFSAAKQSKTRTARIEKSIPRILEGKGLKD